MTSEANIYNISTGVVAEVEWEGKSMGEGHGIRCFFHVNVAKNGARSAAVVEKTVYVVALGEGGDGMNWGVMIFERKAKKKWYRTGNGEHGG